MNHCVEKQVNAINQSESRCDGLASRGELTHEGQEEDGRFAEDRTFGGGGFWPEA